MNNFDTARQNLDTALKNFNLSWEKFITAVKNLIKWK